MKHTVFSMLLLISFSLLSSQSCKKTKEDQIKYFLRPREGGADTVIIDTKTSLKVLVKRLDKPWKFTETYKADLIGYTNDMYNIAFYQDKAIEPLLDLIHLTSSKKTKLAALYTLHLIGIECQVARRGTEVFKDTLARKAILALINDRQLQWTVIYLLKRDPWKYDIPPLIDYLSNSDTNYILVLKSLRRHFESLEDKPLWQNLPKDILNKEITIKTNSPYYSHPIADMIALKNTLKEKVIIDEEILQSKKWSDGLEAFKRDTGHVWIRQYISENNDAYLKPHIDIIESFRNNESIDFVGMEEDDRFIYAYENDKLYIYGPNKAKKILIKWWANLPDSVKQKYSS